MQPSHYISVHLRPVAGTSIWDLASAVVRQVHGHLQDAPGSVALALPGMKEGSPPHPGRVFQVFSDESLDLGAVMGRINGLRSMSDMLHVDRSIHAVPEGIEEWAAFTRFRVPNRGRRARDTDACFANRSRARAEAVAEAEQLPTIPWRTARDKGGSFGLSIRRMPAEPGVPLEQGALNGYGLSSAAHPFWLPVLRQGGEK
ncbi:MULTISPECIES: type I-F CRISPR-associated endoribonuclease Cas6/Csy4 [unclassified Thioalkalivibrio]|uniref:type I-F CRISPR-associated endoribonuclease Cas6/Csy4 n=1 Tax=unclassified Thioalkalivibrio TaxID=2621013 RepID=UPI000360D096|nr:MULTISPECIES: type I-F CRISPR-associated endoribonuclease Cas6/Csy4 [unclassified Thioalkalivibrio]